MVVQQLYIHMQKIMKLETALKPVTKINSKMDQRLKCKTRKNSYSITQDKVQVTMGLVNNLYTTRAQYRRRQWHPLQYSCLENPMDGGAWQAAVHGVARGRTRLSDFTFTFMHWRRKWQPTPVFLPGESQGCGSLVGCCLWGCTDLDTTEATQQQQQSTVYERKILTSKASWK